MPDRCAEADRDVMQVCRNGHVITDLLRTFPERGLAHCDRCGAATLACCPTCGMELPGRRHVAGLVAVGATAPPHHCAKCGNPFPWAAPTPDVGPSDPLAALEHLLRRLPRVVRQLRSRHGDRPAFRVEDEHDLADLVRALLPLHFDAVRPQSRTPRYAPDTRTDFLLPACAAALVVKRITPGQRLEQIDSQLQEDLAHYTGEAACRLVFVLLYDPEAQLPDPRQLERAWSRSGPATQMRCLVAS